MIRIITACALVSLAAAAVIPDDAQAKIVSYHNENDGSGTYDFSFETSNGITREETGRVYNVGAENQFVDVQGSYSYTDPNGQLVEIYYTADRDGYRVVPKPSPVRGFLGGVPPSVVKALLGES